MNPKAQIMTLSNLDYWPLNLGHKSVRGMRVQCRTGNDVYFSDNPSGNNYYTLKANQYLEWEVREIMGASVGATDLVTNGNFTGNATGWTFSGANFAYGTNNIVKTAGNAHTAYQRIVTRENQLYEVNYTTSSFSAGTFNMQINGNPGVTRSAANNTFKEYILGGNNVDEGTLGLKIVPNAACVCTFDDVSIKEVNAINPIFFKGANASLYLEVFWF